MTSIRQLKLSIQHSYQQHPLSWILLIGVFCRFLASIFGGGYIASDDHFLVIHIAWRWLNGYYYWLGDDVNRFGHSLLYPGAHYLLLKFFHTIGFTNTDLQMTAIRMLHAGWSLPVIYLGYRFTEKIHTVDSAKMVGWMLAVLWILPAFSVRQLGEVVSMLPLFISMILAEKYRNTSSFKHWLWAGLWLGLAFCLRYQAGFVGIGIYIALLILRKPKEAIFYTMGSLIGTIPIGVIDWVMYGTPYANPIWYFQYNSSGAMFEYITRPWYNYILLILGVFIFPFGLFLFAGFFRAIKKAPLMFAGTFAFLFIHSIIPNKQERFLATILPELIILGCIGIELLKADFTNGLFQKTYRYSYRFFWVLNIPLLLLAVFTYNKHAEIKSLSYLQNRTDLKGVFLDQRGKGFLAPWYYLGNAWKKDLWLVEIKNDDDFTSLQYQLQSSRQKVDFIIIYLDKHKEQRRKQWEETVGPLIEEKIIQPSIGDWILHKLNPKYNPSLSATIYRTQ